MDIIQRFLTNTCTVEQQSLITNAIHTIENFGLTEINISLDELGHLLENNETFEIIQTCYNYIGQYQHKIFDEIGLDVNCENIATSDAILNYLSILEESDEHVLITEIIDAAETPYDALIDLFEKVCYSEISQIEDALNRVSAGFIERIYNIHFSPMRIMQAEGAIAIPEIDSRKKTLLFKLWGVKQINSIKHFIVNGELNLPISDHVILSEFRDEIKALKGSQNKQQVAYKLLEIALISKTEWKDLKQKIRSLAKDLYGDDPKYIAELHYQIDNVCMQEKINGSF